MGLLGSAIIKTLVLMVEGVFFVLMAFIINRSVMSNGLIIKRTLKLQMIATTCFILILIWGSFNGYLW